MSQRSFNFPISTLTKAADRLLGALGDETVGPAVLRRLPAGFDARFEAQIRLVTTGGTEQSGAAGEFSQLTAAQNDALAEMERLTGAARDSAALFLPKGDPRLRAEFQVGINEPQDLAHELERAGKVLAACGKYADDLSKHGWLAEDTQALSEAITALGGADHEQETTADEKKGITATRNRNANALYAMCKSLQNAAELAYPETQIGKKEGIETARARFLLDEFPPRTAKSETATTQTTQTPDTPAAAQ